MNQQSGYASATLNEQIAIEQNRSRIAHAQDQYIKEKNGPGVKQTTLTEQVGQAHELVEALQKLLSGLETRLGPILSFAQPEGQNGEATAGIEPPLIDEAGRLILRLRHLANRVDDIERRVRL